MDAQSDEERYGAIRFPPGQDIVESPWRKGVDWMNIEEELARLTYEIENYEPLSDFLTGEVSFPQVNILLFGLINAGKSSVVNTLQSVFRRKIFNVAASGCRDRVLTRKFSRHHIMSSTGSNIRQLKFNIWDMRGLDSEHHMSIDTMKYIVHGNIPDKFLLDLSGNISADMPGFKRHPKLDERIHCVAIIQDANIVNVIQDARHGVTRNIKAMQTVMNELDVPQVMILTKVDEISEGTHNDVSKALYSTKIKRRVTEASKLFGLPTNSVFPMKNYECETQTDPYIDVMALITLKGILNQCDAYLYNHLETINTNYRIGDRR